MAEPWIEELEQVFGKKKEEPKFRNIEIPPSDPIPKNVKNWKIDPITQELRDKAARELRIEEGLVGDTFGQDIESNVLSIATGRKNPKTPLEPTEEEVEAERIKRGIPETKSENNEPWLDDLRNAFNTRNIESSPEEPKPVDDSPWLTELRNAFPEKPAKPQLNELGLEISEEQQRVNAFRDPNRNIGGVEVTVSGMDEMGSRVLRGLAGHTSILGEKADPVTNYLMNQAHDIEEQNLTPEQIAKLPFNKQVMRAIGMMVPIVAGTGLAMVAGAPATALAVGGAAIGSLMSVGGKTQEVDEGATAKAAAAAGSIEAMANAAASAIPFFGATPLRAAVIGAASNAIQGAFTDTVNKAIYANTDGNKQFADKYDPLSLEARAIDFITGGIVPFVGKFADVKRMTQLQRDTLVDDLIVRLQRDFDGPLLNNIKEYDFDSAYTSRYATTQDQWTALVRDLLDDNFIDYNRGTSTVPMNEKLEVLIDFARKNPTSPEVKAEAEYIQSLWPFVKDESIFGELLREITTSRGRYEDNTTILRLKPKTSNVRTFVHELRHLVTARAMDKALDMDLPTYNTLDKHGKYIVDSIRDFDKFYKFARVQFVKHHAPQLAREIADFENGRMSWDDLWTLVPLDMHKKYNMASIHEFMADLTTRKEAREALSEVKLSPTEAHPYVVNFKGNKLGKFLVGEGRELRNYGDKSLLDLGLFHAANIYDYLVRGGVGKIGTGFTDFNPNATAMRAMFGSADDIEDVMSRMPSQMDPLVESAHQFLIRKFGQIMSKSEIPGERGSTEWGIKMAALFPTKAWQQFIHDNTATLLKNQARYSAIYEEFVKNPANNDKTRAAVDPRSIEAIFQDLWDTHGNKGDLNKRGTIIYGKEQLGLLKNKSVGDLIAKHYNDKINEYRILKEQLYYNFLEYQKKFMELKSDDNRIKVSNAAAYWDSPQMREYLRINTKWWPDENELRTKNGLNDEEVAAYLEMAAGYDYMYTVLDTIGAALQSRFHPDDLSAMQIPDFRLKRIPGFMPHFHEGTIKVMLQIKDANGTPISSYTKPFGSIFTAERFIKKVQKANDPQISILPDKNGKNYYSIENRSPGQHGLMSTLVDNYEAYTTFSMLAPELANKLAQFDMDDARGYNKSLLQRKDVGGYSNQADYPTGILKSHFGFFRNRNATHAFALYEKYARGVADFAGNTFFVKDVWAPMLMSKSSFSDDNVGELTNKMPTLKKYLEDQTRTFTGESVNKLAFIDDALSDLAVGMKTNPQFFKFLNRNVRGLMSTVMLRNPRNWYANFLQPINGVGIMYSFAVDHNLVPVDGSPKTSPYSSLAKAYDQVYGGATPETHKLLSWARSRHILDPVQDLYYGLQGHIVDVTLQRLDKALFGGVNPKIEELSRTVTFLTSYDYVQQFYHNKMDAMLAAERLTSIIMVNYDRSSRPHLYTKFGIAGEAASAFAVFRNAYIGNSYYMFKTMIKNPTKIDAYKGLIAGQLGYIMTAGLLGVVGASEYNSLVDLYNSFTSSDDWKFPRLEEFAIRYGLPDYLMFGLGAEATKAIPYTPEGFNVGASATAPGVTSVFAPPLIPFIQALVMAGFITLQQARALVDDSYAGASSNDIYKMLKKITPPQLHDAVRRAFANDNDVGARSGNTEGMVDITESDVASTLLFGSTGLNEWKERRVEEMMNRKMTSMRQHVKNFVDKAADNSLGIPGGMDFDQAFTNAKRYNPILTYAEFEAAVVQERISRITSKKTRDTLQRYDPLNDKMRDQYEYRN